MQYVPDLVFIFGYGALSFILSMFFAPYCIALLRHWKLGKNLRETATTGETATVFNELHKKKVGTPTMGGVLIWGTTLLVVLLSRLLSYFGVIERSILQRDEMYLPLFALVATGILGLVDDWFNIKGLGKTKGLAVKPKMFLLLLFAGAAAYWFHVRLGWDVIHIPRVGDFTIGFWYIPLFMFIIIATANAVNITDGLDGLASGLLCMAYTAFGVIAYAQGKEVLAAFCAVVVGALVSFLWHNISPAKFIMGDTGAISLGATLGVVAMLTNSALVLAVIGGIFVLETLSSALQIASKKFLGRKIFKIAPFHHHLEALGWPESSVVMRLWILGALCGVIGMIIGLIGTGVS